MPGIVGRGASRIGQRRDSRLGTLIQGAVLAIRPVDEVEYDRLVLFFLGLDVAVAGGRFL